MFSLRFSFTRRRLFSISSNANRINNYYQVLCLLNFPSFLFISFQLENHLRNLKLSGHVGFDSLPDQLVNKSVQNGFVFNILCISETGLGKSTLLDSLFNTNFESTPSPHTLPSVKLKAQTFELQESNVRLKVKLYQF